MTIDDAAGTLDDAEALDVRTADTSTPLGQPDAPGLSLKKLREGGRGPDGRWQKGCAPRLRHGLRLAPDHPALATAHRERTDAIAIDLGGDLPTLKRAAAREAARLDLITEGLGEDLMRHGVLTATHNQRAALSAYVMTLDRLHRLMVLLGLERRGREIKDLAAAFETQGRE